MWDYQDTITILSRRDLCPFRPLISVRLVSQGQCWIGFGIPGCGDGEENLEGEDDERYVIGNTVEI